MVVIVPFISFIVPFMSHIVVSIHVPIARPIVENVVMTAMTMRSPFKLFQ